MTANPDSAMNPDGTFDDTAYRMMLIAKNKRAASRERKAQDKLNERPVLRQLFRRSGN